MIAFILRIIASPVFSALWRPFAVALGVLGFGAWQRRQGAQAAKADHIEAEADAERKAHERINEADTGAGLSDDQRIERLRDFAAKHGNRPPKAGGR